MFFYFLLAVMSSSVCSVKSMNNSVSDNVSIDNCFLVSDSCSEVELRSLQSSLQNVRNYYRLILRKSPVNDCKSLQGSSFLDQALEQHGWMLFVASDWNSFLLPKECKEHFEELEPYDRVVFFFANYSSSQLSKVISSALINTQSDDC